MATKKQNSKPKKDESLKTDSMLQAIKDRIEAGKDKEYFYEVLADGVVKFTKVRHIVSDGEPTPLEQHWVEFVDLKQYNKILNNFNENKKRCDQAIKNLKPVVAKLQKMLGKFDIKAYRTAQDMCQKFEQLDKYQNQLESAKLQKADVLKWKKLYESAKSDLDSQGRTQEK